MYIEKGNKKLSCVEFLLSLGDVELSLCDTDELSRKYPLPPDWMKKVIGKRVIGFWLGMHTIHIEKMSRIRAVIGLIDFIVNVCKQTENIVLWWIDDGLLKETIKKQETKNEYLRLMHDYQEFIKKLNDNEQVIHDETCAWNNVLAWACAFYGDEGDLCCAFRKTGKPVFIQDANRQNFNISRYVSLDDWLNQITNLKLKSSWQEPTSWCEITRNRRVVLYYMEPSGLLGRKEAVIYKLERIAQLAKLRKNLFFYWCNNLANEQILNVLPYEIQECYHRCQKVFLQEDNCLIDSVNMISDALDYADVYYGDDCIWLSAFKKTGKPIIIQDYDLRWNEVIMPSVQQESFALSFIDGVWVGDKFYFPSWFGNGLFFVRKGSEVAHLVSIIPVDVGIGRNILYCSIEYYENKLFLIPTKATKIMVYDLITFQWSSVNVNKKYAWDNDCLFIKTIRQNDELWLMPLSYYAIGRLNLRTCELTLIGGWGEDVQPYIFNPNSQHFICATNANNYICFIAWQSNHIISLSKKTLSVSVYQLDVAGRGLMGLCTDGDDFWIIARDGDGTIYRWTPNEGIKGSISGVLENGFNGQILYHNGNLWFFSTNEDRYLKYNVQTGKISKCEHYLPPECSNKSNSRAPHIDGHYFYFFPNVSEELLSLDINTGNIELKKYILDRNDIAEYIKGQSISNKTTDRSFYSDNEMASYIEETPLMTETIQSTGQRIYKNIY